MIDDVAVADLTGFTGTAQARRDNGDLVTSLTFAWINAAARQAALTASATGTWPLGNVNIDLRLVSPAGQVVITPTFSFKVIEGPTRV